VRPYGSLAWTVSTTTTVDALLDLGFLFPIQ
jgi:hypothetical protein